jgi:hypothetical protein
VLQLTSLIRQEDAGPGRHAQDHLINVIFPVLQIVPA